MRSLRRSLAFACIVTGVLPHIVATAVALHVVLHHHADHDHSAPVGSLLVALHGHVHSADTPDHDHSLAVPPSSLAATRARGPLQPALPVVCAASGTSWVPADHSAADLRSAPRPPPHAIPTVLRI